jgi:hypothetical protein
MFLVAKHCTATAALFLDLQKHVVITDVTNVICEAPNPFKRVTSATMQADV